MYQLRFLIGSPRRHSPHLFSHRDYRGQRTAQDDFHPDYKTFICHPTESKTSQEVMMELLQHAAQHQAGSQLFPIVELYNPQNGDRVKLQGDEIVLRPADLKAAQERAASLAETLQKQPAPEPPAPVVEPVPEAPAPQKTSPQSEPQPEPPTQTDNVRTRIQQAVADQKKTAVMLSNELGISTEAIKATVAEESSGLTNKGGWISLQA